MRVSARPSKAFLFSRLKSELKNINGEIGVDAAPANFKNYTLFKTNKYVGVDISSDLLLDGKAKHPEGIAILHDLSTAELPFGSVDVVVSTNTLQQIPSEPRMKAIRNFCCWVKPDGVLFMEMDQENLTPEINNLISSHFEKIDVIFYRNSLSKWFEGFLEREGRVIIDNYPRFMKKAIYAISKIISLSEYITYKNKKNKKHIFVKCSKKIDKKRQQFSLDGYTRNNNGLYYCHR